MGQLLSLRGWNVEHGIRSFHMCRLQPWKLFLDPWILQLHIVRLSLVLIFWHVLLPDLSRWLHFDPVFALCQPRYRHLLPDCRRRPVHVLGGFVPEMQAREEDPARPAPAGGRPTRCFDALATGLCPGARCQRTWSVAESRTGADPCSSGTRGSGSESWKIHVCHCQRLPAACRRASQPAFQGVCPGQPQPGLFRSTPHHSQHRSWILQQPT
mmetsp:Transcript_58417/g.153876  ORF Transcript_58417/g.153876 Transcript_58417/m.153876 type:complete len:212 (-) Transcript_58417:707-1342(-)